MTDTLDQLKKAFHQAIATTDTVTASNEPLTRRDAVQSGQAFGAPVVQGGLGSWVASSGFPYTAVTDEGVSLGVAAPARNVFETSLGLPGVPDVDFVPYNWNTNRFGGKGPSLLGHPISWEVVGPTLKSPYCDWQWHVDFGANTLTMEQGPNPVLPTLPTSVTNAYNYSATFDDEGGLYVLLTFTGEDFDGALKAPRTAIKPSPSHPYRAPFELFRVESITPLGRIITLRGEKRLSDYYAAGDGCRAITLIRPKVTRLAALPAPVYGQAQANRTFVFLPPETSATSEYMPPYDDGASGVGTWLGGKFDVDDALPPGIGVDYGGSNPLPIPRPIGEQAGTLGGVVSEPSKWEVNVPSIPTTPCTVVRILGLRRDTATTLVGGSDQNALGYFYITKTGGVGPYTLTLRRVPEIDPDTGAVFYGNGPASVGTVNVTVQFFESLSTLFLDGALNLQKLAAARLTNLIDPRTAGPSINYRDSFGVNQVPASKPDRVIFNTVTGQDPGNLLDLGFRAVFFPAKTVPPAAVAVPDFEKPIDAENVVLNPATIGTTRQFIDVDYSAGVAYLSETPLPGGGCQVAPSFVPFSATNNPRHEIVLFAACVPYSMEEGQTGAGIRVTASSLASIDTGFGGGDLADVYGRRVIASYAGPGPTFTPGAGANLLTDLTSLTDIPPSGFFFLIDSSAGVLTPGSRIGPYYYQGTTLTGTVTLLGVSGPAGPHPVVPGDTRVVLQRSLRSIGNTLSSADTVRGSAKRLASLSFKGADVTFGADGSVTVEPRTTLQRAYEAGNAIGVSAAEGAVTFFNSTDLTNTLFVSRTFAGPGIAVVARMGAGTTGTGVLVQHSGTVGTATGIEIRHPNPTAAHGLWLRMLDAGTSGNGILVDHAGAASGADGIQVEMSSTVGTGAGIRINQASADPAASGLDISMLTPATTAVGIRVTSNPVSPGTNVYLQQNGTGTGLLIDVMNPLGTGITVSDAGGPAVTTTVNPDAVTSGAFLYPVPNPTRTVSVAATGIRSGIRENVGTPLTRTSAPLVSFTQEWRPQQATFGPPDILIELEYVFTTTRGLNGIIELNPYLRSDVVLTSIVVLAEPATAQTVGNRMTVTLYKRALGFGLPTVIAGSTEDDGTATQQNITLTSFTETVNLNVNSYYVVIVSSQGANTSPGDAVHGLQLWFNDPGPRNY